MINSSGLRSPQRKYIPLLLAASFSWLFIASLINFHIVHLTGKQHPLVQSIFLKPNSDKHKQLFSKDLSERSISGNPFQGIITEENDLRPGLIQPTQALFTVPFILSVNILAFSSGLRAPPSL